MVLVQARPSWLECCRSVLYPTKDRHHLPRSTHQQYEPALPDPAPLLRTPHRPVGALRSVPVDCCRGHPRNHSTYRHTDPRVLASCVPCYRSGLVDLLVLGHVASARTRGRYRTYLGSLCARSLVARVGSRCLQRSGCIYSQTDIRKRRIQTCGSPHLRPESTVLH